ncbi:MAG: DNA polymerase III subunit gamma/tau [Bacilli bacterium]|nr:DNA polymerase III subunit gamma/tau [Bacilli bacterium]
MGYLALYRKYRPNNFDDLVGQNSVSAIIKNEILFNKLSHAYLFSGPRGTGKTSTAKIIAKMINCENLSKDGNPCGKCSNCINFNSNSDIVEIDAASNNGVDEIRNLRDKVNLVPSNGKYKVYIIDEVHMLTVQAFNALLKTLEEPPNHVIFILATTEFYKIPSTVVSRCQKFQFFKFSNDEIVQRLSFISNSEKIDVDKTVLFEIARLSDGGLRDAINLLDQLSAFSDDVNIVNLYKLAGVVSYVDIANLLKYIYNRDIIRIVNFINDIDNEGKSLDRFLNDVLFFLKDFLLLKNDLNYPIDIVEKKDIMIDLLELYDINQIYDIIITLNDLENKMRGSSFSTILMITYFVKLANDLKNDSDVNFVDSVKISNPITAVSDNDKDLSGVLDVKNNFDMNLKKIRINNSFATASRKLKDEFCDVWVNIKSLIDGYKYGSVVGFIDDLDVLVVGENNVIFMVKYDSLMDRIYSFIFEFESLLKEVYNKEYSVVIITSDEWTYEKNNYVLNMKNGYKYSFIEESGERNLINSNINNGDDVDKIVNLLGEDIIVYE